MRYKLYEYENFKYYVYEDGKIFDCQNQKFLHQMIGTCGYLSVYLGSGKQRLKQYVHRIVAKTFVENNYRIPIDKLTVNHKDYNKQNNNVCNLEWMTREENARDSYNQPYHKNRKLNKNQVSEIKKMLKDYSDKEIADKFNVNKRTILGIRKNKNWKNVN